SKRARRAATGQACRGFMTYAGIFRLLKHLICQAVGHERRAKMESGDNKPSGPDFTKGIPAADLAEGAMLTGHVGDDEVMLARQGGKLVGVSTHCTPTPWPLTEVRP